MAEKISWLNLSNDVLENITSYNEEYKDFLSKAKTERLAVKEIIRMAEANGFKDAEKLIEKGTKIKKGDKLYFNNKEKSVLLFVIGEKKLEDGMRVVGAHIDSPRLDLKQNPLYEASELAFLKTHYYGGVKKYQWTTIPLALHGVVYTKDLKKVEISIGEDDDDPVFTITDLLIHLSREQMQKKLAEGILGEQLNVLIGTIPLEIEDDDKSNRVKANVMRIIKEKYGIEEEDFKVAEIEVVPAGKARDLGIDRSMIFSYGQDDRVCAFAGLKGILDMKDNKYTALAMFMDKEEVGSQGNTGMASYVLENALHELAALEGEYSALTVRRCLKNSWVLSADVTAGYDPNFDSVYEKNNSAVLGGGIAIAKYTGSGGKGGCNDANAEFLRDVRDIFDKAGVAWQTGELGRVDAGGGGTIAYLLSKYGAEVVDCGTAVLNMHAPNEITSKFDTYMSYKAYKAFFE